MSDEKVLAEIREAEEKKKESEKNIQQNNQEVQNPLLYKKNLAKDSINGTKLYNSKGQLVVTDTAKSIKVHSEDVSIKELVELAKSKGWEQLNVKGNKQFKMAVAKEAIKQGMTVKGVKAPAIENATKEAEQTTPDNSKESSKDKPESNKNQAPKKPNELSGLAKELKERYELEKVDPLAKKDPRLKGMARFEKALDQAVAPIPKKGILKTNGKSVDINLKDTIKEQTMNKAFNQIAKGKEVKTDHLKVKTPEITKSPAIER